MNKALAAAMCGMGLLALGSGAATFTVNSQILRPDVNPGDGLCQDSAGLCNLSAAVTEANALAGQDTILIQVPAGSFSYDLTDSVIVDGNNQDFNNLAFTIHDHSTIRNMRLYGPSGGLSVMGSHNTINNLACPVLFMKGNQNAAQDMTCTNLPGYLTGTNNSFTGCLLGGIGVDSGRGDGNQFFNCRLAGGLDLRGNDNRFQGLTALPFSYLRFFGDRNQVLNSYFTNAYLRMDGTNNLAGGTRFQPGNISLYNGRNNTITGCEIWGNPPLYGTGLSGIYIENARDNTIGGDEEGAGNVIGGHDREGLFITGAASYGNRILGNLIGVNPVGIAAVSNRSHGIWISGAPSNTVGGMTETERNIVSGNGGHGLYIFGDTAAGNRIHNNYIGLDITGSRAIPNRESGLRVLNAPDTHVGSDMAGGNVISGNRKKGVYISAHGAQVRSNQIGVDPDLETAFPNGEEGLYLYGNGAVIDFNQIAGNGGSGLYLQGNSNQVIGCSIGFLTETGIPIGNDGCGIEVRGGNNKIGRDGGSNFIALNAEDGIFVSGGGSTNNVIRSNFIGLDRGSTNDLGNGGDGIRLEEASGNIIGDRWGRGENAIGFNRGAGIGLYNEANGNRISGNYIGTDHDRTNRRPNAGSGILIAFSSGNLVLSNQVVCSGGSGVELTSQANSNVLSGNFIGISWAEGENTQMGNAGNGITLRDSSQNRIGIVRGANLIGGNWVVYSGGAGVRMLHDLGPACQGNAVLGNVISENAGLGIDLGPYGVTPNDEGDNDAGPNQLQNFPVIQSIASDGRSATFSLSSKPNTSYYVELFSNWSYDESGYGDGNAWQGAVTVTTDSRGQVQGACAFTRVVGMDENVTALATDPQNNTSEFSAAYPQPAGDVWAGATPQGGGWYASSWFGSFLKLTGQWIWSPEHGYVYAAGNSPDSVWFYNSRLGWWWTSRAAYSYIWLAGAGRWYWYLPGSSSGGGPGWFVLAAPPWTWARF